MPFFPVKYKILYIMHESKLHGIETNNVYPIVAKPIPDLFTDIKYKKMQHKNYDINHDPFKLIFTNIVHLYIRNVNKCEI